MIQQQPGKSAVEQIIHARQTLSVYDEILSSLIDVATLKMNDPEYDPTGKLEAIYRTLDVQEKNKAGILDVESLCDYRFRFLDARRAISLLKTAEEANY